jgi:2-keto-4-pentenoate hydratase/2-oxohepta-3-ene-1,7-dioic acid hydratase in catechol pathway
MRIIRFAPEDGQAHYGRDLGDGTAEVLSGDLFAGLRPSGRTLPIHGILAPVAPPNVFGIGLNYRQHARQMGLEVPDYPVVFMKPTTAIANPGETILIPACCTNGPEVDYECELTIVIGRPARNVSERDALQYVLGYTAANEVTARKWAKVSRTRGKIFDRFCPLGPALVTADEIPDPQNLTLSTVLNGEVMQQGNTADMIFPVAEIISHLSQDTTLLPGTVILTGTPPGAGISRDPPVFLKPGDRVCVEIEKIGRLENPVGGNEERKTVAA